MQNVEISVERERTERPSGGGAQAVSGAPLYTAEERARRDATVWTLVQGVLAPLQFLVFLVSLILVVRFLVTGEGYVLANGSILLKTAVLYLIMVTGAIWEQRVFGQYLFAPAFYWEDMVSMAVIALHTLYVATVFLGIGSPQWQLTIALAAYAVYVVNAAQFVWKFRLARKAAPGALLPNTGSAGVSV